MATNGVSAGIRQAAVFLPLGELRGPVHCTLKETLNETAGVWPGYRVWRQEMDKSEDAEALGRRNRGQEGDLLGLRKAGARHSVRSASEVWDLRVFQFRSMAMNETVPGIMSGLRAQDGAGGAVAGKTLQQAL
jgi:hypothetical protein